MSLQYARNIFNNALSVSKFIQHHTICGTANMYNTTKTYTFLVYVHKYFKDIFLLS
jgi:hypothetical protein